LFGQYKKVINQAVFTIPGDEGNVQNDGREPGSGDSSADCRDYYGGWFSPIFLRNEVKLFRVHGRFAAGITDTYPFLSR
jgi:hypothetical protein